MTGSNNVRKRNNASKPKPEEKEINKKPEEMKEVQNSKDSKTRSKSVYIYVICAISVFVLSSFNGTITKSFKNFQRGLFEASDVVEEVYSSNEYLNDQFILEKRYFYFRVF